MVYLPEHAGQLLGSDPYGVLVYGDVARWPTTAKKAIFSALRMNAERDPWFRASSRWVADSVGGLACKELIPEFRDCLKNEKNPHILSVVLDALGQGVPLPDLGNDLLDFIRDDKTPDFHKGHAVSSYIHTNPSKTNELVKLLNEVNDKKIKDEELNIRSSLLESLYPAVISPKEVANYFIDGDDVSLMQFGRFISSGLLERTPDSQLQVLMDALLARADKHGVLSQFDRMRLNGGLLRRLLTTFGDKVKPKIIYSWLRLPLDEWTHPHLDKNDATFIREFIEQRPKLYKALFKIWLHQSNASDKFHYFTFGHLTHGAKTPINFFSHLLDIATAESETAVSEFLFTLVAGNVVRADRGTFELTFEEMAQFVGVNPRFAGLWDQMCVCEVTKWQQEHTRDMLQFQNQKNIRHLREIEIFNEQLPLLREGKALHLLDYAAQIWFGLGISDKEHTDPFDRLKDAFTDEIALAAKEGFERTLRSGPHFSPEEIAVLHTPSAEGKTKRYFVSWPILAGADIVSIRSQDEFLRLSDESLKSALTHHLVDNGSFHHAQPWDTWLYSQREELAAEVLYNVWKIEISRPKAERLTRLFDYSDDAIAPVAAKVILRFLEESPTRSYTILQEMIFVALGFGNRSALQEIARKALESGKLDSTQETLWLSVAFLFAPNENYRRLITKVRSGDAEKWACYQILLGRRRSESPPDILPSTLHKYLALKILAGVLLPVSWPRSGGGFVRDTNTFDATQSIQHLVNQVANDPDTKAATYLEELCSDMELTHWHDYMKHARSAQAQMIRDSNFTYANLEELCGLLAGKEPISNFDLQALVVDVIDDVAQEIRHENTDPWKMFWNTDPHNRPTNAKAEEACRDIFLVKLKPKLIRHNVHAEPEGHFAEDKRADIIALHAVGKLPIEIKKTSHSDLWTAARDQLVRWYTRDPEAGDLGVYLVLWFGDGNIARPPPGVAQPSTPDALQSALYERLEKEISNRVVIRVLDFSAPIRRTVKSRIKKSKTLPKKSHAMAKSNPKLLKAKRSKRVTRTSLRDRPRPG